MTSKFDLENYSEVELGELIKEAEKLKASKAVQTKINAYEQLLEIAKGVGLSLDELIQFGQENSKKEPKKAVEPKYRNKANPAESVALFKSTAANLSLMLRTSDACI